MKELAEVLIEFWKNRNKSMWPWDYMFWNPLKPLGLKWVLRVAKDQQKQLQDALVRGAKDQPFRGSGTVRVDVSRRKFVVNDQNSTKVPEEITKTLSELDRIIKVAEQFKPDRAEAANAWWLFLMRLSLLSAFWVTLGVPLTYIGLAISVLFGYWFIYGMLVTFRRWITIKQWSRRANQGDN